MKDPCNPTFYSCSGRKPRHRIPVKRMCELSTEERENMGMAGRKHMEDQFDKCAIVEETLKWLM